MDEFSVLDSHPALDRSVIFVTWEEAWPLERYVRAYLRERGLPSDDTWVREALVWLGHYPEDEPLRKSDADYFLDINAERWLPARDQFGL